ncbi:MAG: hypothetical protein JJE04_09945 [Acidobacteriia bacterium]|nr:hypothetical protein [Terriglobia bacterium]
MLSHVNPRPKGAVAGVTLMEMIIVVMLLSLMIGITYPALTSGIETLRLNSAAAAVAGFLNAAVNRAERRGQAVEIIVTRQQNTIRLAAAEPGFERVLTMPDGVAIEAVLPQQPVLDEGPRQFLMLPGSLAPRMGVVLLGRRGDRRTVRLNPISGAPQIDKGAPQ